MWVAAGHDLADMSSSKRHQRRAAWVAEQEARKAQEEKEAQEDREIAQSAFGGWEEARDAIVGVEDEIAVEDAAATLRQTHVGEPQPWTFDVAVRTKRKANLPPA